MSIDEYLEKEIEDLDFIQNFVKTLEDQEREMILTSQGKTVGAILTAEQYRWFLDQLDANQDTRFIDERVNDREGAQSLEDFKKELRVYDASRKLYWME